MRRRRRRHASSSQTRSRAGEDDIFEDDDMGHDAHARDVRDRPISRPVERGGGLDLNSQRRDEARRASFAPLPDEGGAYRGYEEPNRGPLVLALAVCIMIVFGVVVYNAYKQGVRQTSGSALPHIASQGAFKRPVVEDGAKKPAYRVFDQVDGSRRAEAIAPANVREEPVPISAGAPVGDLASKASGPFSSPEQPVDDPASPDPFGPPGQPVDLRNRSVSDAQDSQSASKSTPRAASPPSDWASAAPSRDNQADATVPARPVAAQIGGVAPGDYLVQLAAVRSGGAADDEWSKAAGKAPDLFANVGKLVQTVDLGDKGVWHRVMAVGFSERVDASAFCEAYKSRGGDCIVKAK